jgi:ribosomal-protein-alanine N-acetyltransferase
MTGAISEPPVTTEIAGSERIVGFVGMWFMVDDAHIVTIAVEEERRRMGLGEMLLIAATELAQRRNQEVLTLECRASNLAAQALYEKYGFRKVGVRKRYYTDNDEDALIMTTFPIQGDEFKGEFERLRTAWAARRGAPRIEFPEPPATE